jgi:predicted metal-dependent phosphoesterase TrpH
MGSQADNPKPPGSSPFVDLHIHTFFSGDAQYSPEEIFKFAAEVGLCALAITDHDSVGAIPKSLEMSKQTGIDFVPSIELTTDLDGRELHILGYYIEPDSPHLKQTLDRLNRARFEQALERLALLRKLGFKLTYEEAVERSHDTAPSGTMMAAVILDKNEQVRDSRVVPYISGSRSARPELYFFQDYMAKGAPAYVPRRWIPTPEAVELLLRCGAVPVLAHPGAGVFSAGERLIVELKEAGLKGLEVFTTYHDDKACRYYLNLAKKLTLIPTAGSDFHGRIKPHVAFGAVRAVGPELISVLKSCRRAPEEP